MNKADAYGFRQYQVDIVPGNELRVVNIDEINVEAYCGIINIYIKLTMPIVIVHQMQDGCVRLYFVAGVKIIEVEKFRWRNDQFIGQIMVNIQELISRRSKVKLNRLSQIKILMLSRIAIFFTKIKSFVIYAQMVIPQVNHHNVILIIYVAKCLDGYFLYNQKCEPCNENENSLNNCNSYFKFIQGQTQLKHSLLSSVIQFTIRYQFLRQLQFRVLLEQNQLFLILLILLNLHSCDSRLNRILNNNKCWCAQNYNESEDGICLTYLDQLGKYQESCKYQDCKDLIWTYEECDDGNDVNRDGCSDCKIVHTIQENQFNYLYQILTESLDKQIFVYLDCSIS
ncbi:unnamed protein product [Paramecium sonneborni]|uniref:Uncharacterized protein n=1 Tax=Paramecium sonneborni TaxID=65129 RepID=A0A8S1RSN2_9CILI|nr:unnamed protein product [Paramecium sonneborni]